MRDLWKQEPGARSPRLTALERDAARLHGERGAADRRDRRRPRARSPRPQLQIMQIDQDLRSEVGKELPRSARKTRELVEKRVAAEDQLKRIDIRAPQDGMVHQLAVHTVGGVISAGEPMMLIVPDADALVVEARIAPQDIDQLSVGQPAVLRFSAFNQRTTPRAERRGEPHRPPTSRSRPEDRGELLRGPHRRA